MLCFKSLKSSPFLHFYGERGYHTPIFDFRQWHSQKPFSVSTQLVALFQRTFKYLILPRRFTACQLYSHDPLIDPVYYQKAIKITNCHFSRHNNTLQQKVEALANLQGPYLRTISDVNLSAAQSPIIKRLFNYDSSSRAQTGLPVAKDRGCANTLQD